MKNLLSLILVFTFISASAQYDITRIDRGAVAAYEQGLALAEDGRLKEAIEVMKASISRDASYIDAYLSLAGMYGQIKDYRASVKTYEQGFALDTNYTSDYRLPYSINLAGIGEFSKALATINALLARPTLGANTKKAAEYRRRTYQFAVDYETTRKNKTYEFKPVNMGPTVNSNESEYFPSMPIDGSSLIFTRRIRNYNEDFFASRRDSSAWTPSFRLTGSINTSDNEGAQNISQDGNWLVFTACNRETGFGSCDIYISYLTNAGWSEAMNLGKNVNTESWESQPCLSPDKRELYFVSNRPGGLGGSDIYVSRMGSDGRWGVPQNLGPGINTSSDESSPFIHADNLTLYFTSAGLPGYGNHDLFLTRRGGDGNWGKPENLGYPINTIDHEGTLFIQADGNTAYYSSDRTEGRGGLDIYSFNLREDIRPNPTVWIRGKVFDKKTGAGLPSNVELTDLATKRTLLQVQTDEMGSYLITLPSGKDFAFNVARRGYLFYSDNFLNKNKTADSVYQKDIPLQPLEANASVVLRNIFFDTKKFNLKPESEAELDRIVTLMKENPTITIQIEGHTDNVGKKTDNATLSQNRSKSVVAYLVSKGIAASRLTPKGFGADKPVAPNTTEPGRALNRRTELKILKL